MAKKNIERKEKKIEKNDIFKTWADSYKNVSKMWEDSYSELYKPWIESTGELFEKASLLSKEGGPGKYTEFYEEWMKTYQDTFGKFYPIPTMKSTKEILEKLLTSAEESNELYKSWIAELEENSQKTRELLKGEPDPEKYKECYDIWMKSYEKIYDEMLSMPTMGTTKEIFEKFTGIPDIYSRTFVQLSKLWKNSYTTLYRPWTESMVKMSEKMAEISKGGASPEAYKEFYDIWMDAYKETYGDFMRPSKEVYGNFVESSNVFLDMYKSWMVALEKMMEKANELSKQTSDPEAYKEFNNLWVKMYEKAFDNFFEDMPVIGPMKEMMEPVKTMAKINADTFARMSKMWIK